MRIIQLAVIMLMGINVYASERPLIQQPTGPQGAWKPKVPAKIATGDEQAPMTIVKSKKTKRAEKAAGLTVQTVVAPALQKSPTSAVLVVPSPSSSPTSEAPKSPKVSIVMQVPTATSTLSELPAVESEAVRTKVASESPYQKRYADRTATIAKAVALGKPAWSQFGYTQGAITKLSGETFDRGDTTLGRDMRLAIREFALASNNGSVGNDLVVLKSYQEFFERINLHKIAVDEPNTRVAHAVVEQNIDQLRKKMESDLATIKILQDVRKKICTGGRIKYKGDRTDKALKQMGTFLREQNFVDLNTPLAVANDMSASKNQE